MASGCKHGRDLSWTTDLIWQYLHQVKTEAKPRGHWYREMDPSNELSDRHQIYELLINEGNLTTKEQVAASKIPWNQNNAGFLKTVNGQYYCGSLIKIVFTRYMGWSGDEPKSMSVGKKGADVARWVIKSLEDKKPVRVALSGKHYVGIVGHRCRTTAPPPGAPGPASCSPRNEFLCIEPWAGGSSTGNGFIRYAGNDSCFLGIIQQDGAKWTYDGLVVSAVEFDKGWFQQQVKK